MRSAVDHSEDLVVAENATTRRSLAHFAGEAISASAFWGRTFGESWHGFNVPSNLVTLAKQAAEVRSDIATDLAKRRHS